jgi:hypothetical protein
VKYGVAAGGPTADRLGVRQVAFDQLATELAQLAGLAGRADQRGHVVTALAQLGCDVPTDEASGAGDEGSHLAHSIRAPVRPRHRGR